MILKFLLPISYLMRNPHVANWLSVMVALLIVVLSLTPLPQLPDVTGSDKTHHIIAYAALAIPTAIATPRRVWLLATLYVLLGGMIELIQPFVNRYGEWLDFIANIFGVSLGSVFGLLASKLAKASL